MQENGLGVFKWAENPFSFKIIPELFVGYTNEANEIINGLQNGDKFSILLGPTGSGKTTLIKYLINRMDNKDGYKIIYLAKPPKNPEDWILVFGGIIRPGFFSSILNRKKITLYELGEAVKNKLGKEKCILFVDECHEASIESLEWLRTLTDQIDNLVILLAGLPVTESVLKANLETFVRRLTTRVELTNLTKYETRELIKKRIESVGGNDIRPFTEGTIEMIYEITAGFPREILRMCNDLTKKAAEKNITTIDSNFLAEAKEPARRISIETIHELPERQKLILEALSKIGEATPSEIIRHMKHDDYKNHDNAIRAVNNLLVRLMKEKLVERKRIGKTYKYKVSAKFQTLMVNA